MKISLLQYLDVISSLIYAVHNGLFCFCLLSPSGCTFWGKKPWSRKKKILWQLGTLVGAPVGITLIAGIAVPAMIIGIPVWVGRKVTHVHKKYFKLKFKRNIKPPVNE